MSYYLSTYTHKSCWPCFSELLKGDNIGPHLAFNLPYSKYTYKTKRAKINVFRGCHHSLLSWNSNLGSLLWSPDMLLILSKKNSFKSLPRANSLNTNKTKQAPMSSRKAIWILKNKNWIHKSLLCSDNNKAGFTVVLLPFPFQAKKLVKFGIHTAVLETKF